MFIPLCLLAVIWQIIGIVMVWVGLHKSESEEFDWKIVAIVVSIIVFLYTLILFFIMGPYTSDEKHDNTNSYILRLACGDMIVLLGLMIVTNGIKGPFTALLFTIPAVISFMGLPPELSIIVVCGMFLPIFSSFFYSLQTDIPKKNYLWINLMCLVVIFFQIGINWYS
ncbi:MAG: hypothetical protein ACUZ77_08285 [Candidatus Brocadiales bacterium]